MTRRTREEIEALKQAKKEPSKAKKNLSAYIPGELLGLLKAEAEKEHRSVNGQLVHILARYYQGNFKT